MAESTPKPNNTPRVNNAPRINNTPKNMTIAGKKIENMTSNELNKLSNNNMSKLLKGNINGNNNENNKTRNMLASTKNNSFSESNKTKNKQPNNGFIKPTSDNNNDNNGNSGNKTQKESKTQENNQKNNQKNKDEPSLIDKGLDKIGDTFLDIKNSIIGSNNNNRKPSNQKESKENKESKNNKEYNDKETKTKENTKNDSGKRNIIVEEKEESESVLSIIFKIVILVVVLVILYYLGKYLISNYLVANVSSPYLLNNTKNAKHALVVSQDSSSVNYIPIKKSEEQDGIEFTYSFWFLIDNFDYKKGEWKHVLHKGNASSYPNRAPGIWFHPDKNSIRVYMNTVDNILEYADIDNIPIRKWVYMNVILKNRNLDLYINGFLKIRKELGSIPKQNDDDLWISMFGGFEGYLSNIRYYSYAIDFNEINNNIKIGPSKNNCIDTGEVPPYLDDNWWFSYNG